MTDAMVQGLHEREESRIRRFFSRRLGNREDAVDATQETFMRMLEASRSTLIENPQAYLFQVARSVARVASERAARERAMFVEDSEGLEHAEDRPIQDRIVNARQSREHARLELIGRLCPARGHPAHAQRPRLSFERAPVALAEFGYLRDRQLELLSDAARGLARPGEQAAINRRDSCGPQPMGCGERLRAAKIGQRHVRRAGDEAPQIGFALAVAEETERPR